MTADGDHRLWQQEGEEAFRAQRAVPDPLRRITVDDWRKLSFRAIDNQRRDDLTEAELLADWHRYFGRQDPAAKHDHDADVLKARMVRRRRGLPDEHYQAVAEVIKKARARGERQVLNVVMAEFSRTPEFPQVSRDMANNWRRQAQKRGYLPPPTSRD